MVRHPHLPTLPVLLGHPQSRCHLRRIPSRCLTPHSLPALRRLNTQFRRRSFSYFMDIIAIWVFAGLFAFVSILGFVAARWRAADLTQLDEWGLGGRAFGTVITWFLLG